MAYFGYLAGHRYAHEATQDPALQAVIRRYMDEEATPTLRPVPGIDLEVYKSTLIDRFANPHIRDTLARLCAESSDRIPKWLLPVVRENLEADRSVALAAAVCASWARYDEAVDEMGQPIVVVDRLAESLMSAASSQHDDPLAFLRNRALFGDLVDRAAFTAPYLEALNSLWTHGSAATLILLRGRPHDQHPDAGSPTA